MTAGTVPGSAGRLDMSNGAAAGMDLHSGAIPADRGATPAGREGRGTSLVEQGYVCARFGDIPVLVGPELAAKLKAIRQARERRS